MPNSLSPCLGLLLVVLSAGSVRAENWPNWRGPRGDGTSTETALPLRWDAETGENIAWKFPVPGRGHSSPIVWGERLFLTTCMEADQARVLICLNSRTGEELWQTEVLRSPLETIHKFNSHASGTPATDGETVFVPFLQVDGTTIPAPNVGAPRDITPGRVILTAIDFDGKQRWQTDVGEFISAHGFCSCPVLYRDLVILNGDHDGDGYLVALDKATGKEVWRTGREQGIRSYVTPIIREIGGRDQLVLSGSGHVAAFDPTSGELIWKVDGPTEQFVASMVFDGKRFILAAGYPTHHVMAIRAGGEGDVTATHIDWHVDQYVRCYVPSPVLIDQWLFVADDRGTANCFDSTDGTRIWQARLSGAFNSSLVATDRSVYFLAADGVTKVVKPAAQANVLAENRLGEACDASPAISQGRLYIRGEQHLFCIADRDAAEVDASE
ncbi:MAG: serine/threonine protein kinase [Planctomycetaceae bacterium]|nr:MAG: serine/threonine protein kinase [Planctomycetaceae bacterium]